MTTEEKLQHFYEVSMDTAREEATKVLDEYKAALETEMERHKQEKQAASESQFKIDSDNAAREINKALSAEHLHIKRKLSKKQQKLKESIFAEVEELLDNFSKKPEYTDWLEDKIKQSLEIAENDSVQIYLTAKDSAKAEELTKRTGITPLISETDFLGGIRAVIPEKNILIDNTFLTAFENEKERFNFDGGFTHE
ncbi:V-type ATP synthase subunit E [Blautia hansenii]|uniref:V-type ATP synthase subunit E n=1 Tax=Blautia hansenii TaxID=1322 RepID=UPI0039841321